MKLGILQCDSVLKQFVKEHGDYPEMFRKLFERVAPDLVSVTYNVTTGQYPATIDEVDAYLITGSKASVYDNLPWLDDFNKFIISIHEKQKTLVGVCFGHQLIAELFGGQTEKAAQGWGVGVATNRIYIQTDWMKPAQQVIRVPVSHQDQVTRLPTDAVVLAGSDFCPYFMYQLGAHIVTIQGHPEYTKDYIAAVMHHRAELLGSAYQKGSATLNLATDEIVIAKWLLAFMSKCR